MLLACLKTQSICFLSVFSHDRQRNGMATSLFVVLYEPSGLDAQMCSVVKIKSRVRILSGSCIFKTQCFSEIIWWVFTIIIVFYHGQWMTGIGIIRTNRCCWQYCYRILWLLIIDLPASTHRAFNSTPLDHFSQLRFTLKPELQESIEFLGYDQTLSHWA